LVQAQCENDLVMALQSGRTIGKAIGLVMERFDLDDHEAFLHLATLSQKSTIKLRDVAAHLVEQSNDLRHVAQARQTLRQQHLPGLTLVPRLDATQERGLDAFDGVRPLTNPTAHDEGLTLLPDP
jgi:hypothetical protein